MMARRLLRRASACTCAECTELRRRRRQNLFAIVAIDPALWVPVVALIWLIFA